MNFAAEALARDLFIAYLGVNKLQILPLERRDACECGTIGV